MPTLSNAYLHCKYNAHEALYFYGISHQHFIFIPYCDMKWVRVKEDAGR